MPRIGSARLREPIPSHGTDSIYYHQLTFQDDVDGGFTDANSAGFGGMNPLFADKALNPTYDVPALATGASSAAAGMSLYGFPNFMPPAPEGYGDHADATSSPLPPATPKDQEQSFLAPSPKNGASFDVLGSGSLAWSPTTLALLEPDYGDFAGPTGLSPLSSLAHSPTAHNPPAFTGEWENDYSSPEPGWFADSVALSQLNAESSLGAGSDVILDHHTHFGALQNRDLIASTAGRSCAPTTYATSPQRVFDHLQLGSGDPFARQSRRCRSPASLRTGTGVKGSRRLRRSSEPRSPHATPISSKAVKQSGQYACAVQGCPNTYSKKADADRHYRGQHDLKAPRYFDRCGYGTTRKDHYLRHHGYGPEEGQPCNRPPCRPYHSCRCGQLHEDKNEHLHHVIACRRGQPNLGRPRGS